MNLLYITEQPNQALLRVLTDHADGIVSAAPEQAEQHLGGHYRYIVLDLDQASPDLLRKAVGRRGHARLLVLLAHSDASTRAEVLHAGADLCMAQPVNAEELHARMHALSRHYPAPANEPGSGLWLSSNRLVLGRGHLQQNVTVTEQRLLALLAKQREPISRQAIEDHLWGTADPSRGPLIERHVCNLRRKLGELGLPYALQTLRGFGYCLNEALRLRTD